MSSLVQSVLVGAAICGAAAYVLWRVVGPWLSTAGKPGCPSCASGHACADTPSASEPAAGVHPLVVIRTKSR
jgi:hypothetical protein